MSKVAVGAMIVEASVLLLAVWFLNHQGRALTDARRDAEVAHLALRNVEVAHEMTRKQLQATEQDLLAKDAELQKVVSEAKVAAPGARVTAVTSLRTGVLQVQAPAQEPVGEYVPPTCEQGQILYPDGMGGFYCAAQAPGKPSPAAPAAPAAPTCALRTGEGVSLGVDQVVLTTQENNLIIAGVARAWREPSHGLLAEGRFQSALSDASTLAPPGQPRWGAELLGACAGQGCGLGAGVLFPPVSFWGLRVEARAGALLGPVVQGVVGVGLRW